MAAQTGKQVHHPHITPLAIYLGVGAALLILTVITVWVAQFHFGPLNLFVAMAIATVKAALVGLIFMHLLYDNKFYLMIFLSSILFLAVFIAITMLDTMRRADIYQEVAKPIREQAIFYDSQGQSSSDTQPAPPQQ